jgi:hypothetical protein
MASITKCLGKFTHRFKFKLNYLNIFKINRLFKNGYLIKQGIYFILQRQIFKNWLTEWWILFKMILSLIHYHKTKQLNNL